MLAPYKLIYQHRVLAYELVRRELFDRYGNAVLGGAWVIIQPLALMLVFAFIFTIVFNVRFDQTPEVDIPFGFGTFLIMGYQSWMSIMMGLSAATLALTSNAGLLKQIDFPSPVLVVKIIVTAIIAQVIGIVFGIVLGFLDAGIIHLTALLVIPLLFFQILFIIGLGWILAALTVFFRDISELLNTFFLVNLYIMPVIWPPGNVPGVFEPIIKYNPFSYIIYTYQDALGYGKFEHPIAWIVFPLMALFFFHFGYWLFRKMEPVYGDML
ncbi:ABC transporter permease [Hyphobacterium sp.]|uniref:ABC transporter permease n=1 Tax=Hyphobacterium sp. TaxID=2004662 RepID=UPI003BAA4101